MRVDAVIVKEGMLSEWLVVLLPTVGFAQCAASAFTLIVLYKGKNETLIFANGLAVADFLSGVGSVYAAFFGVYTTIYGDADKFVDALHCLVRALFVTVWLHSDASQLVFLLVASCDRVFSFAFPSTYQRNGARFRGRYAVAFLLVVCLSAAFPVWTNAVLTSGNRTVSTLCLHTDLLGSQFESIYNFARMWGPVAAVLVLALAWLVFLVRMSKQSWSYALKDRCDNQVSRCLLARSVLSIASVTVPVVLTTRQMVSVHLSEERDIVLRLFYGAMVCVMQPLIYIALSAQFTNDVGVVFKRYSHNTKRDWLSADDPPPQDRDRAVVGESTLFGSWYSMTGNVAGEAGLPIESAVKERSISFYNDIPQNAIDKNQGISNAYKMNAIQEAKRQERKAAAKAASDAS